MCPSEGQGEGSSPSRGTLIGDIMASKKKEKKRKAAPVPKEAYEVTVEVDGQIVFDKPVTVRRRSELNGIATKQKLDVGQKVVLTAKRVF